MARDHCPTCGAPTTTEVMMRGGEWGWGTTDRERTVHHYDAPTPSYEQTVVMRYIAARDAYEEATKDKGRAPRKPLPHNSRVLLDYRAAREALRTLYPEDSDGNQ